MPIALLYHDVAPAGQEDASGFPGASAGHYKLTPESFRAHLDAIRDAKTRPVVTIDAVSHPHDLLLAFDDGGASFLHIADELERNGWYGHFFITTDFIDQPAFLTRSQLRDLHGRGHHLGSHSCSHPPRMSSCSRKEIHDEWRNSTQTLAGILGQKVTSASVPGGFYSRAVAQGAIQAGITTLFHSEPITRIGEVDGCRLVGRFSIVKTTSAARAAAFAAGAWAPRFQQYVSWNVRKLAKTVARGPYAFLRTRWLSRGAQCGK